jgi:hypothetical protein
MNNEHGRVLELEPLETIRKSLEEKIRQLETRNCKKILF